MPESERRTARSSLLSIDLQSAFLCPVASACGGCPLLHLRRVDQLELKRAAVKQAITTRFAAAGREEEAEELWRSADVAVQLGSSLLGYRHRIRLQVTRCGFGFFNPAKGQGCAVLAPSLESVLHTLKVCAATVDSLADCVDYAELRAPDSLGRAGLLLTARHGCFREAQAAGVALVAAWTAACDRLLLVHVQPARLEAGIEAPRAPVQRFSTPSQAFVDVPLDAFVQINPEVSARLVSDVIERAVSLGVRRFADLFCGAGNFAIPLARALSDTRWGHPVSSEAVHWAVESHGGAIEAARHAAEAQGLIQCLFFEAHDLRAEWDWPNRETPFDLVIANPPRAGLRESLPLVAAAAANHLVLVSCDPSGLAKDLLGLLDAGLSLESLTLYDMFPGTDHVETVAWLSRAPTRRPPFDCR